MAALLPRCGLRSPAAGRGELAPGLLLPRPAPSSPSTFATSLRREEERAGREPSSASPSLPSPPRTRPAAVPHPSLHGGAGGRAAAGPWARRGAAAPGAAGELGGVPGAAGARRRAPRGRHRAPHRAALRARELPAGRAARGLRAVPLPGRLPRRHPLRLQVCFAIAAGLGAGLLRGCALGRGRERAVLVPTRVPRW